MTSPPDQAKRLTNLKMSRTVVTATLPPGVQHIIFSSPSFTALAEEIVNCDGSRSHEFVACGNIQWKKFEDGFPNLMISNVENIRGRDVIFLADFLNHSEMFAQLSVILSLPRYFARSLTLVLPYFPTGTMERIEQEGQIATAVTLATILSAIPLCSAGPARIVIYDIHALQERFYFHQNVLPLLMSAIPLLRNILREEHAHEPFAIAFPDEGALKRFGNSFPEYEIILCSKIREGDKRVVSVREGDPKGRHVLIVDDLVKTGGTLIECKNALLAAGALKVSAYVTHAVFPQDSWKRFLKKPGDKTCFERFFTTNSCPVVAETIKHQAPFHILSLAHSILDCLKTYHL